jgi:hypothetical protein
VKALTLWRPWDQAILRSTKDIENRTWAFPASMLGQRIALHAGQTYEVGDWPWPDGFVPKPKDKAPAQAIVGVATLVGWLGPAVNGTRTTHGPRDRMLAYANSPWFSGTRSEGYGWVLGGRLAIEPVPCRGAQGLWTVPAELLDVIETRIREATSRAGRELDEACEDRR